MSTSLIVASFDTYDIYIHVQSEPPRQNWQYLHRYCPWGDKLHPLRWCQWENNKFVYKSLYYLYFTLFTYIVNGHDIVIIVYIYVSLCLNHIII